MQLVRNGIGEEPITQKIEGVKRIGVVAKIRGAKEDIESLKNITIRSNSGVIVSLDEVSMSPSNREHHLSNAKT
jgi:cobalt-zinc-cadmium resistance protein CzcA